jgi:hypothetical protein
MFYLPGSWYVGSALQHFLNAWLVLEFWPFALMDPLDWDDNERRGAGSWCILLAAIAAIVAAALVISGVV